MEENGAYYASQCRPFMRLRRFVGKTVGGVACFALLLACLAMVVLTPIARAYAGDGGSSAIPQNTVQMWVDVEGDAVQSADLSGTSLGMELDFRRSATGMTAIVPVDSTLWGRQAEFSLESDRAFDASVAVTCVGEGDVVIAEARMPVSFNGSDGQTVDAVALEPASGASADDGTQAQPSDLSSTGSHVAFVAMLAVAFLALALVVLAVGRHRAYAVAEEDEADADVMNDAAEEGDVR
ncbi:hypothetical protein [Pseudoscardovia radai]|uniref:hypothetical protein n=1 Tax=Pseudoscardovia radai TaxID=987066 RepID=UPI003994AF49